MAHTGPEWDGLRAELAGQVAKARRSGRTNYYLAYALKAIGLVASIAAGALGIIAKASPVAVGLVALVPGAMALVGQEMKFQQKAHCFYRTASALESILSRARYSEEPGDGLATLAAEADAVRRAMSEEWERSLSFGWSDGMLPKGAQPAN